MNCKKYNFVRLFLLTILFVNALFAAANAHNFLYQDFYKGEPLAEVKKEYPSSFFLDKKKKNIIINLFGLDFLKNLNFFQINNKVILLLNSKEDNRVVAVILLTNQEDEINKTLKKLVKENKMIFKKGYVFFSNGIIYNKRYFDSEKELHDYLINLTIQLSSVKKGLLYVNENFENQKNKKGVFYTKFETVKENKGCTMCAFLGNKSFSKDKFVGILIYERK